MNNRYQKNWQQQKIQAALLHQTQASESVNELVFKKRCNRKIILVDDTELTEFVSCSYLGIDQDERVINAVIQDISACGVSFPAARTRVVAQNNIILDALLNQIFCDNFCVLFHNLHMVHLGFLPLLGSGEMPGYPLDRNGAYFILDKTAHSSIQINRGLMSQFGAVRIISFQDLEQVETQFRCAVASNHTPVAIADSVGSMGGMHSLSPLLQMAERYQGYLYLDDGHGTSLFGKNGCGYVLNELGGIFHPRLILTASLAKAFGAGSGGVLVLPTQADLNRVKRFCSTYIFGGPPPLALINAGIAAAHIHLSPEIIQLQGKLQQNLAVFDANLLIPPHRIINYNTPAPIRGVYIGDEFKAIEITKQLHQKGFAVTAAMYPTVPKRQSMLRLAIGARHTLQELTDLGKLISIFLSEN
ncbi:MAG: aminotransferase class I/II-fold pyridoxal phosphate-dependent enzyme [Enterobacteriaceae bacterium]